MTSWILPEKEKPPSVDSDFSCLVLTVYKLTRNVFHSSTTDVVHSLYPQHLIFRKRGLPLRPLFRKTVLPAEKTLLLPADGLLCSQYCKTSALCCSDRTPGSTETFAPIQTLSPTVIGRAISKCNFCSIIIYTTAYTAWNYHYEQIRNPYTI